MWEAAPPLCSDFRLLPFRLVISGVVHSTRTKPDTLKFASKETSEVQPGDLARTRRMSVTTLEEGALLRRNARIGRAKFKLAVIRAQRGREVARLTREASADLLQINLASGGKCMSPMVQS